MNLKVEEKNAIEALHFVINALKLKITFKTLKEQLYLHPEFPSLLSLSDVLRKWQIPNIATRINYKELKNIPLPAIAFVEINGGIFAPIRAVSDTEIEWLDTQKGWINEPIEDFASKWGNGNVVLLLEPNENSSEKEYARKRREEILELLRTPFIILGLCFSLLLLGCTFRNFLIDVRWQHIGLIFMKLSGVIISSLIIWQSIDSNNSFIRSICGGDSKNDCNNILNSKASKILGWLKWSELGLFYFVGGLIASMFTLFNNKNELIPFLMLFNLLALPYTFYSVYYQYFVAKSWCRLCLLIQLLFWFEFIISVSLWQPLFFNFNIDGLLLILFSFSFPIILWAFVKKPIENSNEVMPLKKELQKSKFNPDYVISLFDKQPSMPPIFNGMQTVKMGNMNAENVVTVVTNPMCGPCRKLHVQIENNIKEMGLDDILYYSFIFTGGKNAIELSKRIFDLPESIQAKATSSWYAGKFKNLDDWSREFAPIGNEQFSNEQVNSHQRWCEIAEIKGTPTIFINGKELPLQYSTSDIQELFEILNNRIVSN